MNRSKRNLLSAAAVLLWPAGAFAQGKKRFRLGFLVTSDEATAHPVMEAFMSGLRERGYHPGNNLIIDVRYAAGDVRRLPALAAELVALNPDVLVGAQPAAVALRSKTTTIPIVLLVSNDPVALGLAKSLARPGTNVTGLANRFDQVIEKHVELLREAVPGISRIALLNYGPSNAEGARQFERAAEGAAKSKGITVISAVVNDDAALRQAFVRFEVERAAGLIVVPTPTALQTREAIIGHADRLRLPAVSALPPAWLEAGGLLNYGANALADYRYAATFVDRILKGGNPAEMPIEQPGVFELAVNLKAARRLGIKFPQSIMARADRVIE